MDIELFAAKLLMTLCLVLFTWAAIFYFKHPPQFDFRKRIISAMAIIATILNFVFIFRISEKISNQKMFFSCAFYLFSLYLFIAAVYASKRKLNFAFSKSSPAEVIRSGPYKYVRHPFYTSYSFTWIAGAVMSQNLVLVISTVAMIFIYYRTAKYEESEMSSSSVADEYAKYKLQTKMFLPYIF